MICCGTCLVMIASGSVPTSHGTLAFTTATANIDRWRELLHWESVHEALFVAWRVGAVEAPNDELRMKEYFNARHSRPRLYLFRLTKTICPPGAHLWRVRSI